MKKILASLLLAMCFITCHAQIIQVSTMDEVIVHFKEANSKTLAVFDIDMVLVQPGDPAFQMANMKRYGPIAKQITKGMTPDRLMIFLSMMSLRSDPVLIDPRMPQLLNQLALNGVPSMGLTANLTGEFAGIKKMEAWKLGSLNQLGIDFSENSPCEQDLEFPDLPSFRKNYSVYTNGVMFVNGTVCPKGEAFVSFMKKADVYPDKIIFIDDREENVKSLESSLKELGRPIDYIGLHYVGAKDYPSEMISESQFEARWKEVAKEALNFE